MLEGRAIILRESQISWETKVFLKDGYQDLSMMHRIDDETNFTIHFPQICHSLGLRERRELHRSCNWRR
jgi:hypothetical protein